MPWYRFYANHGPGHQSHTYFYRWYDKKLTERERHDEWENVFGDKEYPIGKVKLVKVLPIDVKSEKIRALEWRIEEAKKLLKDAKRLRTKLEAIPTIPLDPEERDKRRRINRARKKMGFHPIDWSRPIWESMVHDRDVKVKK